MHIKNSIKKPKTKCNNRFLPFVDSVSRIVIEANEAQLPALVKFTVPGLHQLKSISTDQRWNINECKPVIA